MVDVLDPEDEPEHLAGQVHRRQCGLADVRLRSGTCRRGPRGLCPAREHLGVVRGGRSSAGAAYGPAVPLLELLAPRGPAIARPTARGSERRHGQTVHLAAGGQAQGAGGGCRLRGGRHDEVLAEHTRGRAARGQQSTEAHELQGRAPVLPLAAVVAAFAAAGSPIAAGLVPAPLRSALGGPGRAGHGGGLPAAGRFGALAVRRVGALAVRGVGALAVRRVGLSAAVRGVGLPVRLVERPAVTVGAWPAVSALGVSVSGILVPVFGPARRVVAVAQGDSSVPTG